MPPTPGPKAEITDDQAGAQSDQRHFPGKHDGSRPAADIERLDCDETSELRFRPARGRARSQAVRQRPRNRPLRRETPQEQPGEGAQRAQNPDLRASPHNGNRDRVVDQECADDKGDIAQDPQIPTERGKHFPVLLRSSAEGRQRQPGPNALRSIRFNPFDRRARRDFDQDAIDETVTAERLCGRRQVHRDDVVNAVRKQSANNILSDAIVNQQRHTVANLPAQISRRKDRVTAEKVGRFLGPGLPSGALDCGIG